MPHTNSNKQHNTLKTQQKQQHAVKTNKQKPAHGKHPSTKQKQNIRKTKQKQDVWKKAKHRHTARITHSGTQSAQDMGVGEIAKRKQQACTKYTYKQKPYTRGKRIQTNNTIRLNTNKKQHMETHEPNTSNTRPKRKPHFKRQIQTQHMGHNSKHNQTRETNHIEHLQTIKSAHGKHTANNAKHKHNTTTKQNTL